ncbi:MAG: c-type cytochrome domain-containing protein [Planctomycetota bacterium]
MIRRIRIFALIGASVTSICINLQAQDAVGFRNQVAPILQEHCVACHCAKRAEGGYRLDTIEQLSKAGDGAASPIVAGKRDQSEWILRMKHADPDLRMPLDSEPLSAESIELISKWIDQGAKLEGIPATDPLWSIIPPRTYPPAPEHYALAFPITALAFSSDGTQVFSSGYHEVLAWNAADGALVGRFGNQTQRIYAIASSSDPNKLFVGGGTPGSIGEVRLLNLANRSVEQTIVRGPDVVLDVALRPGSQELAVAMADNTIRIINLEKNEQRRMIASHADWVTQLAYSEDGKRLGSSSRDKSAKVADAETGELLGSYPGHAAAVRGIAAFQDGKQWISVGADNKIHRWEVENAKKVAEIPLGGDPQKLVKDQSSVWIPNGDKHWYRLELANNAIATKQPGHEDWITSIAIHSAAGKIATGSMDGSIRVWNLSDAALVKAWVAKP